MLGTAEAVLPTREHTRACCEPTGVRQFESTAHRDRIKDAAAFCCQADFVAAADSLLSGLRETPPAPGHDRVLYPGLRGAELTAEREEKGIPYHPEVRMHWPACCFPAKMQIFERAGSSASKRDRRVVVSLTVTRCQCRCLVFPLHSRVRHCLCLVCLHSLQVVVWFHRAAEQLDSVLPTDSPPLHSATISCTSFSPSAWHRVCGCWLADALQDRQAVAAAVAKFPPHAGKCTPEEEARRGQKPALLLQIAAAAAIPTQPRYHALNFRCVNVNTGPLAFQASLRTYPRRGENNCAGWVRAVIARLANGCE